MNNENNRRISVRQPSLRADDFTLPSIITILKLTMSQRSERQNFIIKECTKNIKFFIDLISENGEYVHRAACERLSYEFVPAGEYVFHVHTFGKKFYIIIEGQVSILVPFNNGDVIEMKTVARFGNGQAFGELSLIKDQTRAASVLCDTDTHLAVLSKEDYLNIIGKIEARKLDIFIDFLLSIPMFRYWTKKKLEILTYHFTRVPFKRKQEVFTIGSSAEYLYIVLEGEFELTKPITTLNMNSKKERFILKLALLTKGEVFGDEEIIKSKTHSCICTCYSTTGVLLRMTAEDFKMKVTEDFVEAFRTKEKSKDLLRGPRLEKFKRFVVSPEGVKEEKDARISYSKSIEKRWHRAKSQASGKSVRRLNREEIEKIKKKALGREMQCEDYMNLSIRRMVLEERYSINESVYDSYEPSPLVSTRNMLKSVMRSHRPGGYHMGNLKKINIDYSLAK